MGTIVKKIGSEIVHTGSIGTVGAKNNAQGALINADFPSAEISHWTLNGELNNCFFVKDFLQPQDIRKLYSSTIPISDAADPDDQIWQAQFEREDGHIKGQVADGWLVDRRRDKIYVDFGGSPGDKVTLKLSRGK